MPQVSMAEKATKIREAMNAKSINVKEVMDIEENLLPENGVFEFRVEDHLKEGQYGHARIGVKGFEGSVSISNLQIRGIKEGQTARFGTVRPDSKLPAGSKFLRGLALNPELTSIKIDGKPVKDVAELLAALDGRAFNATETTVLVLPFNESGWQDPKDEDLAPKTAYRIHLK